MPGRQTVPRAELWKAIQVLSRVDEKTNIQIPIDAKCVTRGIKHRSELEQGPGGDLWSILFQLIDGRSGFPDVIKVKSHFGGRWPNSYQAKQDRLPPHACKLFGRRCGRGGGETFVTRHESGTQSQKRRSASESVAKRLALVQADIWVKRDEKQATIYELDPLLKEEDARTWSAIGRLVDELHIKVICSFVTEKTLKCKACNVYRADRTVQFLEQNTLRPSAMCGRRSPVSETRKNRTSTRPLTIRFAASLVFLLFPHV